MVDVFLFGGSSGVAPRATPTAVCFCKCQLHWSNHWRCRRVAEEGAAAADSVATCLVVVPRWLPAPLTHVYIKHRLQPRLSVEGG